MRITGTPVRPAENLLRLTSGLLRAGVTRSPSVETPDVLELSGLAQAASALGAAGVSSLQALTGSGNLTEERLLAFVQNLQQSGTSADRTGDILSKLAGFGSIMGGAGLESLFGNIERRGVSGELRYLDELDNLFNLGHRNVSSLFTAGEEMSDEEFTVFLSSLVKLLRNGVVGTLTVDYRGNPTKVFISNEIASDYSRYPLYPERFGA